MKIQIYGHGGSSNHGNEAIVRGIRKILPEANIILYTFLPSKDAEFCLDEIVNLKEFLSNRSILERVFNRIARKITKKNILRFESLFKNFLNEVKEGDIYILEAGDQYCESDYHRDMYAFLNKEINKRKGKTVMMGCTINPEILEREDVVSDLKLYSLIIARESITYNAIKRKAANINLEIAPDPAFAMEAIPCNLPGIFTNQSVVGINAGFLKQGNEKFYNSLIKNCIELMRYIVSDTEFNIALIPHVNWSFESSDYKTLLKLASAFENSSRIMIMPEQNAPKQKYLMSKCRFMVALRTHAAIPSIESKVPTLITGYKTKSSGIARDIFPQYPNLLAHSEEWHNDQIFVERFKWMQKNEDEVRKYLNSRIPLYCKEIQKIRNGILEINNSLR